MTADVSVVDPAVRSAVDWALHQRWMTLDIGPDGGPPVMFAAIRQVLHADRDRAFVLVVRNQQDAVAWCCPDAWEWALIPCGVWWCSAPHTARAVITVLAAELPHWEDRDLALTPTMPLPQQWWMPELATGHWTARRRTS